MCFCTMLAPQAPHLLYVQSVCVILGDFSLVRVRFSGHCHGSKKTNSVCLISRLDDVRVCWMIEMPRFFSKLARRLGV